jgi:hypothetical protein
VLAEAFTYEPSRSTDGSGGHTMDASSSRKTASR